MTEKKGYLELKQWGKISHIGDDVTIPSFKVFTLRVIGIVKRDLEEDWRHPYRLCTREELSLLNFQLVLIWTYVRSSLSFCLPS